MTTTKFIILRITNISVGKIPIISKVIRVILKYLLIYGKEGSNRFTASSKFFDIRDLDKKLN